jgi:hypothetical protein
VHRAFTHDVTPALAAPLPPVTVLGIDETRRDRPVRTHASDTRRRVVADRRPAGSVDAAHTSGVCAQVEGGSAGTVTIGWPTHGCLAPGDHVRDDDRLLDLLRSHGPRRPAGTGRRGRTVDPAWPPRRRLLTAHERLRGRLAHPWNGPVETDGAAAPSDTDGQRQ